MSSTSEHLHTVVVSYNRLDLLKETLCSYRETVTLPYSLIVVDNGSDSETVEWLRTWCTQSVAIWKERVDLALSPGNHYPGWAANFGWSRIPEEATLLHRSDNDMRYLSGWCEEVRERFADPELGQLGLRTVEEEGNYGNVGGNCVIRRSLFDSGLRYDERPWNQVPFEDGVFSYGVTRRGLKVERVTRPCTEHIGIARRDDPYYQETFRVRRIRFEDWGIE